MCHNFFDVLKIVVGHAPTSIPLKGKLNAIQLMADAMKAKEIAKVQRR